MIAYKSTRCTECDALLWSQHAKEVCLCPECENPDEDDYNDLESRLDELLTGDNIMTDNVAVLDGYTECYMAYSADGLIDMFILVKPDTDLDDRFKAWDSDNQEYVYINGWLWTFERTDDK